MPITTTADVASTGGAQPSKKTRTKPIRNADGVLIRKDGRPDMRSVSSAMNLKKVHAKKEAERQSKETSAEAKGTSGTPRSMTDEHDHYDHDDDGHMSHGSRTGSPGSPGHDGSGANSIAGDRDDGGRHYHHESNGHDADRHAANMRKIFPYGINGGPEATRHLAQSFFPRGEDGRPLPDVKVEMIGDDTRAAIDKSSILSSVAAAAAAAAQGVQKEKRDVEMAEAPTARALR